MAAPPRCGPPGGDGRRRPRRDVEQLWFALRRKRARSVVLVPADEGGSTAELARELADASIWFMETPIELYVMAEPSDYAEATALVPSGDRRDAREDAAMVIVATQPVIVQPLGLALARAADAVVVCVEMGRSRLEGARKTVDLIGRDRIFGSFVMS